jgi:hypothetical protein
MLQESLNARYNRSGFDNPWFVFGVSYAGALSAWFRLKFPHLTCGSLASSGVVLAVYNYTDFDKQVGGTAALITDFVILAVYCTTSTDGMTASDFVYCTFHPFRITPFCM